MKWCEVVGTEPYLCLNFGTGTLDEALGWLEYCNSDRNSYYANLRRKNGREKPYNVGPSHSAHFPINWLINVAFYLLHTYLFSFLA
jgi:hypothetical protein